MSDNVYYGASSPHNKENHTQEKVSEAMTLEDAYRLGVTVERNLLVEAVEEYLELGNPEHDIRSLPAFLNWYLGGSDER